MKKEKGGETCITGPESCIEIPLSRNKIYMEIEILKIDGEEEFILT